MSTFRWWAFWRRFQYGGGLFSILLLIGVGVYYNYIYQPPGCFDGEQNGDERGVDCGGSCVRICAADVTQPYIQWVEAFKIVDGQYNALAYIENRNKQASTPELGYTFTFYDETGGVITERSGNTILPPDSVYPVFEGRVMTSGKAVDRIEMTLSEPELWLPATIGRDQFQSEAVDLIGADIRPRLTAEIENKELTEAQNVEIVATIFDRDDNPLTASQTYIDIFAPRSTETIVFTWPEPIAKTLRSCDVPTDAVVAIDLSGSMNNDNDNPPEPISSVIAAASTFAGQFRVADQLALVTFATGATLNAPLTGESNTIAAEIEGLSIDPSEETGSTNTGAAIEKARAELASVRHNDNARKVLILLTDGLATAPDPDPDQFALTAAAAIKADNVEVFTIGLGEEVNMDFLRAIADEPSQAYNAATTNDLAAIYSQITSAICEAGPARIDIIPKTDANFAPLR